MTSEPGSFAQRTMTTRIPAIVQQVLADHADKYPDTIKHALQSIHDEIITGQPMRPLETDVADGPSWAEAYQPHEGKSWHNAPWYLTEAFFYRRLLEASGYFGGYGDYWEGNDPFLPRKLAELQNHTPWQVLTVALQHATANNDDNLCALLHHCVWGNRIDLSYTQVAESTGRQISIDSERTNLLVDDTETVLNHLKHRSVALLTKTEGQGIKILSPLPPISSTPLHKCLEFICDNTGTELLMDLTLTDFLLRFDWTQQIALHVKAYPTFVSDAVPRDIDTAIKAIRSRADYMVDREAETSNALAALAERLTSYINQGRLYIEANLFWNSSQFFWEMPGPLREQLAEAQLVIIKGDANYRRLLGDSRWPTTVPTQDSIPYFPAPFVALRTLKSDPIVGLKPGLAETLDKVDAEWRVNGKRGIIQAVI